MNRPEAETFQCEIASAEQIESPHPREIAEQFVLKETIGAGGFGKVKVAKHSLTNQKVAIKIMDKARLLESKDIHRVSTEVEAMKRLSRHPHIIRLYQFVETAERFYIVMEYARRGELFDYVLANRRLPVSEARLFFYQILSAVSYMHANGFVHRDLKPENLLLVSGHELKLIDFGLCAYQPDLMTTKLKTSCGSPAYSAPEILKGEPYIGPQADVWSMGVLLYAMLCGFLPFEDKDSVEFFQQVLCGCVEMPNWLNDEISQLLIMMLKVDGNERITTDQLRRHPWVVKDSGSDILEVFVPPKDYVLEDDIVDEMARYFDLDTADMELKIQQNPFHSVGLLYEIIDSADRRGERIRLTRRFNSPDISQQAELSRGSSPLASPRSPQSTALNSASLNSSSFSPQSALLTPPSTAHSVVHERLQHQQPHQQLTELFAKKPRNGSVASRPMSLPSSQSRAKSGSADSKAVERMMLMKSFSINRSRTNSGEERPPSGLRSNFSRLTSGLKRIFSSSLDISQPRTVNDSSELHLALINNPGVLMNDLMSYLKQRQNTKVQEDRRFKISCTFTDSLNGKEIIIKFEVCVVNKTDQVGLHSRRVKGDTWQYQRIIQDIFQSLMLIAPQSSIC